MIDTTTLITYGAIVLGFVFIPGPATLLTVTRAASSGVKVGIATGTGIAAGDVVHTFMAIVGIWPSLPPRRRCSASSNISGRRISFTLAFAQFSRRLRRRS
jgi:hypothetical protein